MSKKVSKYYAPNLISICVDRAGDGDYAGRIWHQYDDNPIEYRNLMEMLKKMERLYDTWNFPQCSTVNRQFAKKQAGKNQRTETGKPDTERIEGKRGEKATFLVQVKYRQNATWQGSVTWLEREEQQSFLSVLELLKLMDRALSNEDEQYQGGTEEIS